MAGIGGKVGGMRMRTRRGSIASVAMVLLLVAGSACGSDSDDSGSDASTTSVSDNTSTSAAASEDGEPGVVKIGVVAPLDDGLVSFGHGIENSVQLAVDQANARDAIPGFTIEVEAVDDSSDPETGKAAAEALAAAPSVIGVVGPYNSGVGAEVAPVLQEAGIAMISPGNTDPSLTIGEDRENPARQFDNYFRLVATDAEQGPFLATYAVAGLGATTAAVVSETKPVSKGLADDFTAGFTGGGGEVVYRETVPDGTTDFTDVVTALGELDAPPDLLFFGGEYTVAATYRDATAAAGIDAPLMGGDGIKDDAFITDAGEASAGSIASTVGVPLNALTTAAEFVAAYDAAGFEDPATDFGPYAYDAANLLIDASAEALADSEVVTAEARADVITQLDAIETDGVTGAIAFDDYGDTTTKVFTIYRVEGDAWVPVGGYIGFEL
jgi:branched-chain amino acid transport system substrate-binding protein